MSSTTMRVLTVRAAAMPTGSRLAAAAFVGISKLFRRVSTPRVLTRAEEAASVRELADSVRDTEPGFAADLYAAAARHEALDG